MRWFTKNYVQITHFSRNELPSSPSGRVAFEGADLVVVRTGGKVGDSGVDNGEGWLVGLAVVITVIGKMKFSLSRSTVRFVNRPK